jgi:uncharacterized OB-fold protein
VREGLRSAIEENVVTGERRRFLPQPTPETRPFWDGANQGELRLQRCDACAHVIFPPRAFCPQCAGRKVSWFRASGRGTLYSYVIHHRSVPGFTPPYSVAVVQLEEGPRMMTNIVNCPQTPEALRLDMPVQVTFIQVAEGVSLPQFQPVGDRG